jgi:hypothetical protein
MYGPKDKCARGSFRKLLKEKLQNLYSSPNIVKVINIDMGSPCSRH